MSNIKKLLKGVEVEWKTLGEVCEIFTGGEAPLNATKGYTPDVINKYPIYGNGVEVYGFTDSYRIDKDAVTISSIGANTGAIYFRKAFFTPIIRLKVVIPKYDNLLPKYIFHYLRSIKISSKKSSVPNMSAADVKSIPIPIPCPDDPEKSLEIQKEIVRILDKFSMLTAELQAELQARKSQYEYYRNQLLTYPMEESDQPSLRSSRSATSIQNSDNPTQPFSTPNPHTGNSVLQPHNKVEWKMLGEVVLPTSNIRWKNTNKFYRYIDLTSVCRDNNTIIETIEINKENAPSRAQKLVLKNDVIFATTRPTQQRLCLIPEEYNGEVASTGYCVLRANIDLVLPKWIYFWITSNKFKNYVEENQSGSAYPAISDAKVKEFKIPIPYPNDIEKSLKEQERIVAILDKFNTLTTSITEGLPKEIELRQKQYEYYRDMLLTFPTDNIKV